jgi:hypothetical protein
MTTVGLTCPRRKAGLFGRAKPDQPQAVWWTFRHLNPARISGSVGAPNGDVSLMKPGDPDFDPETIYFEPATIRLRIPADIVDWFKARGDDPKAEIIAALNANIAANSRPAP